MALAARQHQQQVAQRVFYVLNDIKMLADSKSSELDVTEIEDLIKKFINEPLSIDDKRIIHFIFYLNYTDLKNCNWVNYEPSYKKYIRGEQILSQDTFLKIDDILKLRTYMAETIMYTPYSFCGDLVEIMLNFVNHSEAYLQIFLTEVFVLSLLKNINQFSVPRNLEALLTKQFNHAIRIFSFDFLPKDIRRGDSEEDEASLMDSLYKTRIYNDYRGDHINVFNKFLDVIKHKCIEMCNFSIATWISWFEVNINEYTTLQSAIGHLCYDVCSFLDNGWISDQFLLDVKQMLRNIAIEKVDFTRMNVKNINAMIQRMDNLGKKPQINEYVKKFVENNKVFAHSRAIDKLAGYVKLIDYRCFKFVVDRSFSYINTCGQDCVSLFDTPFKNVLLTGVNNLQINDKISLITHIVKYYCDTTLKPSRNFDSELAYLVQNQSNTNIDQSELMSNLIVLVMQQPLKMFNLLISQFITGLCGCPAKIMKREQTCFDQVTIQMHLGMPNSHIFAEYCSWLKYPPTYSNSEQRANLYQWILEVIQKLNLITPKDFLNHVLVPSVCLEQVSDFKHLGLLMNLAKFCVNLCYPELDNWHNLLIQCARILDIARWDINNYSASRAQLCENTVATIIGLLQSYRYGVNRSLPMDKDRIKREVQSLHFMTRAYFIVLWEYEYYTIEGMDEHFIMTIHSLHHISYSNMNASSSQKSEQEFIFCIATYMPKFTMKEMKHFINHYLSSSNDTTILEASLFLWDCVMSAVMRTIVYMKTAVHHDSKAAECAWKYLDNHLVNFIDATNVLKTNCIYLKDKDSKNLKYNSICKMLMVVKHLSDGYQVPVLIVIRRLIDSIIEHLDAEKITKLLKPIVHLNTNQSCRETLGNTAELLTNRLQMNQSSNS